MKREGRATVTCEGPAAGVAERFWCQLGYPTISQHAVQLRCLLTCAAYLKALYYSCCVLCAVLCGCVLCAVWLCAVCVGVFRCWRP